MIQFHFRIKFTACNQGFRISKESSMERSKSTWKCVDRIVSMAHCLAAAAIASRGLQQLHPSIVITLELKLFLLMLLLY